MKRKRIVILFHRNERRPHWYVIDALRRFWEEDGHEVVYLFGTRRFVAADLCFVHVDLSVVPDEYLEFAARYPVAVNGKLRDIRKRHVSDNLVGPDDPWGGPVIAKSDLNYFGLPEIAARRHRMEWRFERLKKLRDRIDDRRRREAGDPFVDDREYKIFDHLRDVPAAWFAHPDTVVEKFLPEVVEGRYQLRFAQVLGRRRRGTLIASNDRVIKAHNSVQTWTIDPDPVVDQWCERFDLDYGKIDYVLHEGKPVLLDINKTTGASSGYRAPEELQAARRFLAEGVYDFFER